MRNGRNARRAQRANSERSLKSPSHSPFSAIDRSLRLMSTAIASPLIDRLRSIVGPEGLLTARSDLKVYECDGFTIEKNQPDVVAFPISTEQIVRIVKVCNELNVPFLA